MLLILGLGGLGLGLTWGVVGLKTGQASLRRVGTPVVLGAAMLGISWALPVGGDEGGIPPGPPPPGPAGAVPADAKIRPVPMIATHTRRAYAIDTTGTLSLWGEPIADPDAGRGTVARIAVGREHLCVLRPSGRAACWGEQREGQANAPAGTFTQITAGTEHSCALRADGKPVCWGRKDGRVRPPEGVRLKSISSSARHTCGLSPEGTVHCWGCDPTSPEPCQAPEGTFIQVSAGHHHTCGLGADLQVQCWGDNETGAASPPQGRFTAVAAGWTQTCALTTQGLIRCWGCKGKLQRLDASQASHCQPPSGRHIALSAGDIWGSCALQADNGKPICWGGPARMEEPR